MGYFYHAVCFTKDREFKIFDSWAEANAAMKGRPHLNKGFDSKEEAQEWLDSITTEQINENVRKSEYWANKKRG